MKGIGHHCAATALLFSLQRGDGSEEADDERGRESGGFGRLARAWMYTQTGESGPEGLAVH